MGIPATTTGPGPACLTTYLLQGVMLDSTAHSCLLVTFLGIESLREFSANEFFDQMKEFAFKPGKLRAWSPTGAAAGR